MKIKQVASITEIQLFLFTLIYQDKKNFSGYSHIDFYPKIDCINEEALKKDIDFHGYSCSFEINISYQLYDKKQAVTKEAFFECGSIHIDYAEQFLDKINEYITESNKAEPAVISLKELIKLLEKTTFLLQWFET